MGIHWQMLACEDTCTAAKALNPGSRHSRLHKASHMVPGDWVPLVWCCDHVCLSCCTGQLQAG
jgi:hypothetical protein